MQSYDDTNNSNISILPILMPILFGEGNSEKIFVRLTTSFG
jgi:hypothetical protein